MMNDAIKGYYDSVMRFYDAPQGTLEEEKALGEMNSARHMVFENARSVAEGMRILRHVTFLAGKAKWPNTHNAKEMHFIIYLQGKYSMND